MLVLTHHGVRCAQVFWRAILAYTEVVLVCKLLYQLPAFCMCNNSYSL